MTTPNNMARLRIVESPHLNAHQSVDILHRYFRSWPTADAPIASDLPKCSVLLSVHPIVPTHLFLLLASFFMALIAG
jgi:hypothetical protein